MRDDWGIVRGIVFVLAFLPATASAQFIQGIPRSPIAPTVMSGSKVPQDVYIMPWIAAGVVYDDNVLFTSRERRVDDVFLRVTPGLQASYQSTPFTIVGNYRFDSEVYNKFTELNSAQQRQFATVETRWRPETNLDIGATVGYAETNTPFELNVITAAQAGRFRAQRYFLNPTAEYRLGLSTKLIGLYSYSKDMFGDVDINSHIYTLGAEHRVSPHNTVGASYVGRYFTFNIDPGGSVPESLGSQADSFQSNAILASWAHEFSPETRLDARAGPRLQEGRLNDRPEVFVDLRHRIPQGDIGLSYLSTVTTIIGTIGPVQADSITLSARYSPIQHFTVTISPAARWIEAIAFDATIYTAYLEGAYQFNKYVTAKGSAYFSYQDREFVATGESPGGSIIIPRNVYWLRLEFTFPSRWD
jgi:hypothetical protein